MNKHALNLLLKVLLKSRKERYFLKKHFAQNYVTHLKRENRTTLLDDRLAYPIAVAPQDATL